ncbi:ABC transporter substrate-binding protein [Streptomyces sp. SBT349]|uniref:ABC transporter substrate-binding protein n=1 Tax=Streptomyces sp. SBT349 TaxID=1580539 RepID=UPI00066B52CE|nr:ABC transporter substrate-binding protein [Streptomyces sp. SBT349]
MARLRRHATLALGMTMVALVVAACGTPSTLTPIDNSDTYADYNALRGDERREALVAAAQEEGHLTVYTTSDNVRSTVAPAFEEEYGISVSVYRATTETIRQRILQETDAGRPRNDVVETNDIEMAILAGRDLLGAYEPGIEVDERAVLPFMVGAYFIATLPIRNTDLVAPDDAPRELADFTDPRWEGRLALEKEDSNWYLTAYRYFTAQGMSQDDFVAMMKGIAANARTVSGHLTSNELLKSGEYSVFVTDFLHYATAENAGPVDHEPFVQPVNLQVLGAVPMRGAENPAAATLWSDFYLTEAQPLLNGNAGVPTNPSAIPDYQPLLPDDEGVLVEDWRTLLEDGAEWAAAYGNLLAGRDPVLPDGVS